MDLYFNQHCGHPHNRSDETLRSLFSHDRR